jgi:tRNA(Ile2) C34 agmatinyltransferase TiaS
MRIANKETKVEEDTLTRIVRKEMDPNPICPKCGKEDWRPVGSGRRYICDECGAEGNIYCDGEEIHLGLPD